LVGQVYFFSRFIEYHRRGEAVVWRHDNCDRNLCERASMFDWKNLLQDFDAFRYGNYNKYKEEFLKKSRSKGNQTLVVAVDIDSSVRGITFCTETVIA